MPVAGAAAITAAGALLGSKMASSANTKASQAQARSADQALAFEREREATRRAEYDRAQKMQQAAWEAREANRLALLRRYGVNVPQGATGALPGASTGPRLSSLIGTEPRVRLVQGEPVAPKQVGSFADLSSRWHQWGGR